MIRLPMTMRSLLATTAKEFIYINFQETTS